MHSAPPRPALSLQVEGASNGWFAPVSDACKTFARKQPLGVIGAAILLAMVLVAVFAPALSPFDPYAVHVVHKYASPGTVLAGGVCPW